MFAVNEEMYLPFIRWIKKEAGEKVPFAPETHPHLTLCSGLELSPSNFESVGKIVKRMEPVRLQPSRLIAFQGSECDTIVCQLQPVNEIARRRYNYILEILDLYKPVSTLTEETPAKHPLCIHVTVGRVPKGLGRRFASDVLRSDTFEGLFLTVQPFTTLHFKHVGNRDMEPVVLRLSGNK
ncbi:Hypothetical protein POVN_LOCUS527 [uncultured virus]|nr:Hypothetical protein POVN_LOCUS527 [uncultured virus]